MTAVNKVAIAGSGVAGLAAAIQLAKAGVARRRVRGEARAQRARLGHLAAGQRPARLRRARRVGRHPRRRLRLRGAEPARARSRCPDRRRAARRQDRRTGLPGGDGDAARRARADPPRARAAGRRRACTSAAKVTGLEQRDDARRGVRRRRVGGRVRPADRRRRPQLDRARPDRHRDQARSRRAWASGARSSRVRPRSSARELYYGGPVYIAGYTPTGEDTMYAFLVEKARGPLRHAPTTRRRASCSRSRARTTGRGTRSAPTSRRARTPTTPGSRSTSSTAPWNRGRVVMIGDAAHSCPPTIAQGAAQGLEDAFVLTELLVARDAVDQELWDELPRTPSAAREGGGRGVRAARPVADRRRPRRGRRGPASSASRSKMAEPA